MPANVEWIVKRDTADPTSGSLREVDPTSGSLQVSGGHACHARQRGMDYQT